MKTMSLKEVLELNLQDGDALLVHTKKFSIPSIIIRICTQGYWNHIALISTSGDVITVVEAETRLGIIERPISFYEDAKVFDLLVMRPIYMQDGRKYNRATGHRVIISARKNIGQKYDFTALFAFTIEFIEDVTHKWWAKVGEWLFKKYNPFQFKSRWFCSEYTVAKYRECGVAVCNGITPASASPNDIYRDINNGMMIISNEKSNELTVYNNTRKAYSRRRFISESKTT